MEKLRFRNTGVSHEENVNVAAISGAVFVDLGLPPEQLKHEGFLDAFHAKDGRGNATGQQILHTWVASHLFDLVFFLLGDDDFFERNVLPLKGMYAQEDVKHPL